MKLTARPALSLLLTPLLLALAASSAGAQPALPDVAPREDAPIPPEAGPAEGAPAGGEGAPAAAPPPPAPGERPPRYVSRRRAPQAVPLPILPDGPERPRGPEFAFEVSSRGLGEGGARPGLLVGGGSRRFVLGLVLGFDRWRFEDRDGAITRTALAIGPGARVRLGGTADGRVDLFGAIDVQAEVHLASGRDSQGNNAATSEPSLGFGIGPGIRLWLHERFAIAALARLSRSVATGGLLAGQASEELDLEVENIRLEGAFSLLGLF